MGVQGTRRRYGNPVLGVDDERYGMGRVSCVEQEAIGLRAEMVVFETKEEGELGEGEWDEREDWSDEMWEARAMHIRRMELIRRATARV